MSIVNGTTYPEGVDSKLIQELEKARLAGKSVYFRLGDKLTGQDWLDDYALYGKLGRSMGPEKILILLKTSRSIDGPAILVNCIVRLLVEGKEVWRHPLYTVPDFSIEWSAFNKQCNVRVQHKTHEILACFDTKDQAKRWVNFMTGKSQKL